MSRRAEITAAARSILEQEGEEALTMRNLADRLGIKAPSLYKHVSSRREIETLLAAEALNEMRESLAAADGLEEMGRSYRAWAIANPSLYRIATTRPLDRENLPTGLEDAAAAPLLAAVDGDRARARAFWALAHGLVLLELDGRFPGDADLEAAWLAGIS
ncbi:MAG TPA: WHG domain-containing protein [Solirubrobacterales bacterium]|nr:WHG domain-containing protein [Solirubrobacterales bacterium]HMX70757.1 WHG domain-containing protein [Solirubrobacterales bacterium]HNC14584.1 WHG domain-containing protein [Solirubrobacterales bacterium]HNC92619.1 WHG domain-containing protein [Solirubrobacterales bacterium]HNE78247.1 WHG domain-containing protein [Solirubrobacterales bacterium]